MTAVARITHQLLLSPRDIQAYRNRELTLQELASRYAMSVTTIWRELKRHGVVRGSRRGRPSTKSNYPRVIELAEQGATRRQIAHQLGMTPEWVRCILAEYGMSVSLRSLHCCRCGSVIATGHKAERNEQALCRLCLLKSDKPTFGQRLKAFRLAANLSQAELGRRVGLSQAVIGNYERDRGMPTLDSMRRLADGLGTGTSALSGNRIHAASTV